MESFYVLLLLVLVGYLAPTQQFKVESVGSSKLNSTSKSNATRPATRQSKLLVSTKILNSTSAPNSTQPAQQQTKPSKRCGIPINVPGMPVNPSKLVGTWYEYMYKPHAIAGINPTYIYKALKNVSLTGSTEPTLAISWINPVVSVTKDHQCTGLFHQSNITSDGRKFTTTWIPDPGASNPMHFTYFILYTNYKTVEISYRCNSQTNETEFCQDPYFWVSTRIKPAKLTASTRSFIASKINFLLGPYCMGTADLNVTTWDDSLGECNPTAPEEFTKLIQSYSVAPRAARKIVAVKKPVVSNASKTKKLH